MWYVSKYNNTTTTNPTNTKFYFYTSVTLEGQKRLILEKTDNFIANAKILDKTDNFIEKPLILSQNPKIMFFCLTTILAIILQNFSFL